MNVCLNRILEKIDQSGKSRGYFNIIKTYVKADFTKEPKWFYNERTLAGLIE